MSAPYDINLLIEVLLDQVEDRMVYVDTGNHPKTPEQIIMTGQHLIQETGMFTDLPKNLETTTSAGQDLDQVQDRFFSLIKS